MYHCLCEYYQGCSNYDPELTLTHFTPRSNLVTKALVWEKVIFFGGGGGGGGAGTVAAVGLKCA